MPKLSSKKEFFQLLILFFKSENLVRNNIILLFCSRPNQTRPFYKGQRFSAVYILQFAIVREAKEKEEAKAKEMKRIASGKEMSDIRASIQEQEIRKLAEQRRREKQEEKEAKAKVLAQIEADKAARRAEREAAKVR